MDKYIVKRRDTLIIPKSVEVSTSINAGLNIMFLTWSVLTIILYFSNVNLPDYIDVGVSISAILVSIAYNMYKMYSYRHEKINQVFPQPVKKELHRRNAQPIPNMANTAIKPVSLDSIDAIDLSDISLNLE